MKENQNRNEMGEIPYATLVGGCQSRVVQECAGFVKCIPRIRKIFNAILLRSVHRHDEPVPDVEEC